MWILAYLLNITHITLEWLFKYAICSDVGKTNPGTLVCFISLLLEVRSFSLLFFSKHSLLIWKYLCVYERIGDFCTLFFETFFSTLLHSHTSFSMGQNDSGFLYNHQLTNPQGLSMARLMITFQFSKIWGENYINFISADEATWLYLKALSVWPHKET